jgi:hypothetical protein
MTEILGSVETCFVYQSTGRQNREDSHIDTDRWYILKSQLGKAVPEEFEIEIVHFNSYSMIGGILVEIFCLKKNSGMLRLSSETVCLQRDIRV